MKLILRENEILIDGYVNAVERLSKVLYDTRGKFIERVRSGVFAKALERNKDVKVLLNHDADKVLADTGSGTANLYEDNIGLRAKVKITDPFVIDKARKNKLRGWSFGFICNKEDIETENDMEVRTIRDLDLFEVSIIDDTKQPAYIGTSIEVRDDKTNVIKYRIDDFVEVEDETKDQSKDKKTEDTSNEDEIKKDESKNEDTSKRDEDLDKYFIGLEHRVKSLRVKALN